MAGLLGGSNSVRRRDAFQREAGGVHFDKGLRAGQNMIRIVKMQDFAPLQSTVLGWEVGDVEAAVEWLVRRGVVLEKYPWVADKERGIWTTPGGDKVAWFKDPD